jgi:hypothetical protein
MANYTVTQFKELIRAPKNRALIQLCWEQHQRARYHIEPVSTLRDLNSFAHNEFMLRVQGVLPKDKYEQFKKFYWPPVPTVDITEKAYTELGRALEAENQYVRAEFGNPENATDFDNYCTETGGLEFWRSIGFEATKTRINSIIIVDVAQTQATERPEPYFYLLEIAPTLVHDVAFKPEGGAEYVLFYGSNGADRDTIFAYDDSFYRVFKRINNASDYEVAFEAQHSFYDARGKRISGIGYCPARRFWGDTLTTTDNIQAKSPLSKVFGKLYEYVFDFVSVRYFGAYGKWPFIWEYENTEPKHIYPHDAAIVCVKGKFIVPQPNAYVSGPDGRQTAVAQKALVIDCEECKKSAYIGPGTIKRISPPKNKTDADLRQPVDFINPNVDILRTVREALADDANAIIDSVTGFGGEPTNGQARNEKDVEAGFEGKISYILRYKRNMEGAHKWTLDTQAIIRYSDDFLRSTVDYGTEFYLKTPGALTAEYTNDKKAGLPDYQLAATRDLISETRFRSNDEQRMRQRVLANLQPYPDKTDEDLQAWAEIAPEQLNEDLLRVRLNFDSYVRKFERQQQMSIVDFGSKIPFDAKIDLIQASLIEYALADSKKPLKTQPKAAKLPIQANGNPNPENPAPVIE